MNNSEFIKELKAINIEINEQQMNQFNQYFQILIEWNQKMNLTRITDEKEVYLKHFYDSATISKIIDLSKEESLCDLGSGAGFPGIVIKILFPHLNIKLVDSLNKRINFLNDVIEKLNLKNITAVHSRIEDFAITNEEKYDIVTARAVAPLNVLLELSSRIVKIDKYFIAMKANISQEIISAKSAISKLGFKIEDIQEFNLPIEDSNRSLIKLKKDKKTSKIYPRKFSVIDKHPL